MQHPTPRAADLVTPSTFRIEWKTGVVHAYTARELRLACPCAGCVDEHTGKPLLDPTTVPEDIELAGASVVGRYALQFVWSDGHKTGIFSWQLLHAFGLARGEA